MAVYTPMINQYLSIKADYLDAFLFFRLGDFYEMFFEDAEHASRILEITLTSRDGGNDQKIPMCGVPYHSAEAYITKLIEKGYKVAICEQTEDPKDAKGIVKREVVRVITPGTVMEGKFIEHKSNNYIAALAYIENNFGLTVSDISTGEFYATEMIDDIEAVLNEINQYNPSEIVIDLKLYQEHLFHLKQIKSTFTKINKLETENIYLHRVKEQFTKINTSNIPKVLIISSGLLLTYLDKTQQKKLNYFNELHLYDSKKFMILDQYSKRNLELTKTLREETRKGSLLALIDQAETGMGSRLLRRWLEKPLLSQELIEERLSTVEQLFNNPILVEDLKNQLKNIYDIERLISKVSYGNATPRDLYNLKISLQVIPNIYEIISQSNSFSLKEMFKEIDLCQDIVTLIERAIQNEPPLSPKVGGLIKRGFNQQLDVYYMATTEGKEWLQELEKRERELTGIRSLKVGYNKVFGYYIEVTKSNFAQVPDDRYIRKQTLANAERYITEELKDRETIILEAEEKMQDLEYQIFTQVRKDTARQNHRLQSLAQLIAKIDVLNSFAIVSVKHRFKKPIFNSDGRIVIEKGRHPVIEQLYKDQPFIPNDVYLDRNNDQILLITGPNMAGKSTFMRQIALTIILAQIGCFVPANSANLAIIDRIFTRIGAGDDLTSGQSTFMVEMLETKQAVTQATPNSLILLDEIGRGTSTYDGMALAHSIIQYIHEHVNAMTLFSTHYHELTSLADSFLRIKNVHVNVMEKDGKVIFLHKIEKGKADKSYGIHVAELAGMPEDIIRNAKIILENLESKANSNGQVQLELFTSSIPINNLETKSNKEEKLYRNIAKKIDSLDLLNISPLEGLQILFDLQKQLRK